jgi:group I intron endonuclease
MAIGIYSITSPSGKVYIGQSRDIKSRWANYKCMNSSTQPIIHRSFLKYGVENHIFKEIEQCNLNELNTREYYWKKHYLEKAGNMNKVLFCSLKDGAGGELSKETKNKISVALKGRKNTWLAGGELSKEHKEKISKSNIGRTYSAESKAKMSLSSSGGKLTEWHKKQILKSKCKPIIQYTKEGELIREWGSAAEAAGGLNKDQPNIQKVCSGKKKTAYGFIWKYKTEE